MVRCMTELDLLIPPYYVAAAVIGLVGQFVRALLGVLKSFRDKGRVAFSPLHFALTQPLGALSGVLGALVYDLKGVTPDQVTMELLWNDRNFILMTLSAGYFGADVIEGVLRRHAPVDEALRQSL